MPAKHVLCAVLAAAGALALAVPAEAEAVARRRNDRAPQAGGVPDRAEARADQYQLISTSSSASKDKVASADLPAADKQYDYPLVRPVYAPFVTRPSVPAYAVPFVEILDHHRDPPSYDVTDNHHRDPPFVTTQRPAGAGHYVGSPMVSTVVVQDLSQTPPRPSPPTATPGVIAAVHHLNPTKIPFTDVQVVTKPLGAKPGTRPGSGARPPNFTDKLEETSLEGGSSGGADSGEDDTLLENPPNLDMSGIVEEVVKKVFRENQVLHDAGELLPTGAPGTGLKAWPCPPVTCCSPAGPATKCSTHVKCVSGGAGRQCPTRAERVPQALALSKPSNGYTTNATDPEADVRDGEPRFKKKKILKKKKKLLKKFLLPLLLAYKLLFLLVVPLLVNGMMMMMSSSGMAGFFFALIGASITMVRVYNGATRPLPTPPPPPKVVKVIKYVQTTPTPSPSPPAPTPPAPTPTIIHHQPFVEEHFPSYHPPPSFHHTPSFGSYYPHPYWNRHYERTGGGGGGALDGGRKRRRRVDDTDESINSLNLWLVVGSLARSPYEPSSPANKDRSCDDSRVGLVRGAPGARV